MAINIQGTESFYNQFVKRCQGDQPKRAEGPMPIPGVAFVIQIQ